MSMPHLNFLDIWGSFDLKLSFKFETFLKLLKLLPHMSKKFRCGMDI